MIPKLKYSKGFRGGYSLAPLFNRAFAGFKFNYLSKNNAIGFFDFSGFKFGFTLAEILITLGIIGIVAAMTIPSLMTQYKRIELETRFNKTYAVLVQALNRTMDEAGYSTVNDFEKFVNLDKSKIDDNFDEINKIFESQFTGTTKVKQNTYKYPMYDFWGSSYRYYGFDFPYFLLLPDGSEISLLSRSGYQGVSLFVYFDTNGPYEGPNRVGYDIFYYYSSVTDKGPDKTVRSDLRADCNPLGNPINGYWGVVNISACSYFARKNMNPYDNTKKYWQTLYKPKSYWKNLTNSK